MGYSKVLPLLIFSAWLEENKETYVNTYSLKVEQIGGEVFFQKLISELNIDDVNSSSARSLSNLYRGKAKSLTEAFSRNFSSINNALGIINKDIK